VPYILRASLLIIRICSNRQDAIEALDIAARGKVKCHYVVRGLSDLKECVFGNFVTVSFQVVADRG
jgi:alcohol dehydrogenase, propanol-preferring